jgi:hypothetical protein
VSTFPTNPEDLTRQAEFAAVAVVEVSQTNVSLLLSALFGEDGATTKGAMAAALALELLAFALHLTDRIAFDRFGSRKRQSFMDAVLKAVQRELQPPFSAELQHLYNTRNSFYATFRKLAPEGNEGAKGTVFWEFAKTVGAEYANGEPAAIVTTAMFAATFVNWLCDAFKTAHIFSS